MSGQRCLVFFVAAVERVIRAFDEDFAPLDQTSGEKCGDQANDNFLEKGRVHLVPARAEAVPDHRLKIVRPDATHLRASASSPKSPLRGRDDPKAEREVR